jgi:hypothetical protein
LDQVPKDPVTSGNAEVGVFAYVQSGAAVCGRMSRSMNDAGKDLESPPAVGEPGGRARGHGVAFAPGAGGRGVGAKNSPR